MMRPLTRYFIKILGNLNGLFLAKIIPILTIKFVKNLSLKSGENLFSDKCPTFVYPANTIIIRPITR